MTPEEFEEARKEAERKLKEKIREDLAKIDVYELGFGELKFREIKKEDLPTRYDRQKSLKLILSRVRKCDCGEIGYERYIKTCAWDYQNRRIFSDKNEAYDLSELKTVSGPFRYPDYTFRKVMCDKCFEPYRLDN